MNKIGLIAGNGRFPFLVAEEIKKSGDQVIVLALKEETDPALEKLADKITWISLGQYQKLIDYFHDESVTTAIMAGQVKHVQLFAGLSLDWRAIKLLGKLMNKKTDTILGGVAADLASEGIHLQPSHLYLKHLLPQPGIVCGPRLSREEKADVEFGHSMAKQIAGLDIGQTVVVKDKCVVAVESIEGTDECIRRAGTLGRENIIVVKVAKPKQDFRFDVPVVGPRTIESMKEARARVLAVDAGMTLFLDKEQIIHSATSTGITITAVDNTTN